MQELCLYTPILFLLASQLAFAGGLLSNDYVRLVVQPPSTAVRPGSSAVVELHFTPVDGIHINIDPPVQFALDSATAITLTGKPAMTKDPDTGYLSTTTPVRQTIVLGKNTRAGKLSVKGTVTYFFCSESEGWCNRQKQPVEFTIFVKP
jgi:YHS domain-containing protein